MDIEKLRAKIDGIDGRLIELLNERVKCALEIGKAKKEQNIEIYAADREKAVIDSVTARNKGPINNASVKAIYREIMSAALALEKPLAVSYLGPAATFTHQAAREKFGASVDYLAVNTIGDVFSNVERGKTDYGVVPIENSVEGGVNYTLDMFIDSDLKICSEMFLKISHSLLSRFPKEHIKTIYSHPQVFGQCRNWIRDNYPDAKLVEVSSTSRAVEIALKEPDSGTIASKVAATLYQMPVLAESIEDNPNNVTRFLVIARSDSNPTGKDKTSLMFSIKDKVGALFNMLKPFKEESINLTKIESRPSKKKPWEYYFFVDFLGHHTDPNSTTAIEKLRVHCEVLKILGSYPATEM